MQEETYQAPAIQELASLHELTLQPTKHGRKSDGFGVSPVKVS